MKHGQKFSNKLFLFKYSLSNQEISRFAFIVSKKVSKSAVKRNKIRRQISSILRLHLSELKKPTNCVVIPHKHIFEYSFSELEAQLINFLKHIK